MEGAGFRTGIVALLSRKSCMEFDRPYGAETIEARVPRVPSADADFTLHPTDKDPSVGTPAWAILDRSSGAEGGASCSTFLGFAE